MPGLFFVVVAVVLMAGVVLPVELLSGDGLLWVLLIGGGGVALLVHELRRARRR